MILKAIGDVLIHRLWKVWSHDIIFLIRILFDQYTNGRWNHASMHWFHLKSLFYSFNLSILMLKGTQEEVFVQFLGVSALGHISSQMWGPCGKWNSFWSMLMLVNCSFPKREANTTKSMTSLLPSIEERLQFLLKTLDSAQYQRERLLTVSIKYYSIFVNSMYIFPYILYSVQNVRQNYFP